MAYESWREQVEEGEQRARQAEIGNVFLIDRGRSFLNCESRQLWRLSYLLLSFFDILNMLLDNGVIIHSHRLTHENVDFEWNSPLSITIGIRVIIIVDIILMFFLILFADVDLVTPLCSQVVYEGLLDDIFRIKCGKQWYLLWLQSLLWNSYTANNVVFIYCVLVKGRTLKPLIAVYHYSCNKILMPFYALYAHCLYGIIIHLFVL